MGQVADACKFKITLAQDGFRDGHLQDLGLVVGNKMTYSGTDAGDANVSYTGTISGIVLSTPRSIVVDGVVVACKTTADYYFKRRRKWY